MNDYRVEHLSILFKIALLSQEKHMVWFIIYKSVYC